MKSDCSQTLPKSFSEELVETLVACFPRNVTTFVKNEKRLGNNITRHTYHHHINILGLTLSTLQFRLCQSLPFTNMLEISVSINSQKFFSSKHRQRSYCGNHIEHPGECPSKNKDKDEHSLCCQINHHSVVDCTRNTTVKE